MTELIIPDTRKPKSIIKYTFWLQDGKLECKKEKLFEASQRTITSEYLSEAEVANQFNTIPANVKTYFRNRSNNPKYKALDDSQKLLSFQVANNDKDNPDYNIVIRTDYKKFLDAVTKFNKKQKTSRNVKIGLTATGIALAIGVSIHALNTAGITKAPDEIGIVTEVDKDENMEEITEETSMAVGETTNETEQKTEVVEEPVASQFTEIDTNKLYDPKVTERNQPYVDLLQRKSQKWGVGYDLLYDILSQEYGGDEANIFHVIFNSWHDQVVTSYNYDLGRYEKVVLTEHPEQYEKITADRSNFNKANAVDQTITPQELQNPEVSAGFANMAIQYNVKYYKGNILLGILAYNWGVGSVDTLLNYTAEKTGYTYDELVAQQNGTSYLQYTNEVELEVPVDRLYLLHIIRNINTVYSDSDYYYVDVMIKGENNEEYKHRYDIKVLLNGQITDYRNTPYSEEQLEAFAEEEAKAKGR